MRTLGIGILCCALAAGCAAPRDPVAVAPLKVDAPPAGERQDVPVAAVVPEPVPEPEPEPKQEARAEPKREAIVAKAPQKAPSPAPKPQPQLAPPPAAKAAEPSLDLASLQSRLRDTKAIGIMTKITLKNQVDDLMKQFRAHYQGGQKTPVAALRPPYDMLVLKVLAVVQDGDPALARTIAGSREAIWAILADRDKFNSVA